MVLERYSIIGLVFGIALIFLDIMLLRKRKIPGKTFVAWFIIGITVCFVSLVPSFFYVFTFLFGAQYLITTVVAVGFSFFLLLFFYLNYRISELNSQLLKLAMQISVSNYVQKQSDQSEAKQGSEKNPETKNS